MDELFYKNVRVLLCAFKNLPELSENLLILRDIFVGQGITNRFYMIAQRVLELNGMIGNFSDDDLISLCVGFEDAPILAKMNGLSIEHDPIFIEKGKIEKLTDGVSKPATKLNFTPKNPADIFPIVDATGNFQYYQEPTIDNVEKSEQLERLLFKTIEQETDVIYPTNESIIRHNVLIRNIIFNVLKIHNIEPLNLNIKMISAFALPSSGCEPSLINQFKMVKSNHENTQETDNQIKNFKWYMVGEFCRLGLGIEGALKLTEILPSNKVNDFLYGFTPPNDRKKKERVNLSKLTTDQKMAEFKKVFAGSEQKRKVLTKNGAKPSVW